MRIGCRGTGLVCRAADHGLILSNHCVEIPLGCEGQFTVIVGFSEQIVDHKGPARRNRNAQIAFARWLRKRVELLELLVRAGAARSEEHTSELQSRQYLVC